MTPDEIRAIPRPKSPADYAACYRANLEESRGELERALVVFRRLRRAGEIVERAPPEVGWVFAHAVARRAWADVVRYRADLDHWHTRKVQAEQEMRAEAVRAAGGTFEPGADDGPPLLVTEDEKAARVREIQEQIAMRLGEKDDDGIPF